MSHSIKVSPESIPKAELALKRNGYTSKSIFAESIGLARATITKFFNSKPISQRNFIDICEKLQLDWREIAVLEEAEIEPNQRQDWEGVTESEFFSGRTEESAKLKQWINEDKCRLIAVDGMAGIGKTALTVKVSQEIEDEFDYIIYRSLKYTVSLSEILANWLQFFVNYPQKELPDSLEIRLARLIDKLSSHRCLLLLDDGEEILKSGDLSGKYQEEYEDYSKLLRRIAEAPHQSCLLFISREKPNDIDYLENRQKKVKSLQLRGLDEQNAREILIRGDCLGTDKNYSQLIELYRGNPFFLKLVVARIVEVFGGNISEFLEQSTKNFDDINEIIEVQFQRLSDLEKEIMAVLANEDEAISFEVLKAKINKPGISDAVASLRKRVFIERSDSGFSLQNLIKSYVKMVFK